MADLFIKTWSTSVYDVERPTARDDVRMTCRPRVCASSVATKRWKRVQVCRNDMEYKDMVA